MILYHGSNVIVEHSKIITSEYGRDFGFGFYTTDIKDQAVRWARRRAKLSLRNGGIYAPYISISAPSEIQKINKYRAKSVLGKRLITPNI